ncbi:MAG: glycosyltransferase family protein [Azonexus sp.]|nr:glycosyltransferase family protein [Azonexus sp.]
MDQPIRLVCATRQPQENFASTALGRSLICYPGEFWPQLRLYCDNQRGLSKVYNEALREAADDPAILVFLHDDLYLCDFFWMARLRKGLQQFDIIGLAGNTRRQPGQPSWAYTAVTPDYQWDEARYLSGVVGGGNGFPNGRISFFGPSMQACKLLDGLFLAADSQTLNQAGVRFDEQFAFHFYDLDFCRQAELKGLVMGTWPISVMHESGGGFTSVAWRESYSKYLAKYGETERSPPPAPPTVVGVLVLDADGSMEKIQQTLSALTVSPYRGLPVIALTTFPGQLPEWNEHLRYVSTSKADYAAGVEQLRTLPDFDWALILEAGQTPGQT